MGRALWQEGPEASTARRECTKEGIQPCSPPGRQAASETRNPHKHDTRMETKRFWAAGGGLAVFLGAAGCDGSELRGQGFRNFGVHPETRIADFRGEYAAELMEAGEGAAVFQRQLELHANAPVAGKSGFNAGEQIVEACAAQRGDAHTGSVAEGRGLIRSQLVA